METVLCVELLTILKLWIVDAKFITEKRIPFWIILGWSLEEIYSLLDLYLNLKQFLLTFSCLITNLICLFSHYSDLLHTHQVFKNHRFETFNLLM